MKNQAPALILTLMLLTTTAFGMELTPERKDATEATKAIHEQLLTEIPWESLAHENEIADYGLIAEEHDLFIEREGAPVPVVNIPAYAFIKGDAPNTVNPRLWEQAKLNRKVGLYQVSERVYQVRGFDIANVSFIKGDTGWIVIDPLTSAECAKAAYDLVSKHLGESPVVAVIYTHSHSDHYAGVQGLATVGTPVYAPSGFMQSMIDENFYAGTPMFRRANLMYGTMLKVDAKGYVDNGLGTRISIGTQTLLKPTVSIEQPTETHKIDGVEVTFQLTNGTEAPSEMNVYFPELKSLCMAENCAGTLHNLLTPRGAQVRDPEKWADYLDASIELFGEAETMFISHNLPRFGDEIIPFIQAQRDCYQYIKDQTLRLMSMGYTMNEIGRMVQFPKSLSDQFFNGEYYGTVAHNVKAVYQKYIGFYDANPVNLNPLLPVDSAAKFVEYMGGADAIIEKARADFENGEYQWVAEVLKQVVFAEPDNTNAKYLLADALEQLGYVSVSGPWRNMYLTGAQELRYGMMNALTHPLSPKSFALATDKQAASMLAMRLNGQRAAGADMIFTILAGERVMPVHLRNSVLAFLSTTNTPAFTVTMSEEAFYLLALDGIAPAEYTISSEDNHANFDAFCKMLDAPHSNFAIMLP